MAAAVSVAVFVGCAPRTTPDLMTAELVCDSTPRRAERATLATTRIPHADAGSDVGAVVGTVMEFGGDGPLPFGDVTLLRRSGGGAVAGPVRVDSLGGFAFAAVSPGRYLLRARALHHLPQERRLMVSAGAVETIRVALRYRVCQGY